MNVQSEALSPQVDDDKCIMHLYLLISINYGISRFLLVYLIDFTTFFFREGKNYKIS